VGPALSPDSDFFRGYRDAHTGHAVYNYGSLDGGVGGIWSARQIVMTTHTSRNHGMKPRDAHRRLMHELATHIGRSAYVPARLTNIRTS
jgi:hypothetical protein